MPCHFYIAAFLCFLSFCTHSFTGQPRECPLDQKSDLLQIRNLIFQKSQSVYCKTSLGFPRPHKIASWNSSTSDCCTWSGITCNPDTGNAISINLGCKPLRSSSMYSSRLLSINTNDRLSNNSLDISPHKTNTSPSMLFQNLSKLRVLIFDGLDMSSIDLGLFTNLPSSLHVLSFHSCKLQGYFPVEVFLFPNLKCLDFSLNLDLYGQLPRSNWSSPLEILDLSSTSFFGELPAEIGNLKSLQVLWLRKCYFTGSFPASLGNLIQLTKLDLSVNKLTGQIPPTFSNLQSLILFSLSSNNFVGPIPDMFINMTKILYLDFSNIRFNASIPLSLLSVPSMVELDLSNNLLSGHINRVQASSLRRIRLFGNQLEGSIPPLLTDLSNLTTLLLSSNRFTGLFDLKTLSQMSKMETLDLSHNMITLSNADHDFDVTLPSLSSLSLSGCNLTKFPTFVRTARNLITLDLSSNRIQGKIPTWMWEVGSKSLAYLNLSNNLLTSLEQVPWVNLLFLDLHSNKIQGPIPSQLPNSIMFFSISDNEFVGQIPASVCQAKNQQILDLSNNYFNSTITHCLGNFSTILKVLDMQGNQISGSSSNFTFQESNILRGIHSNKKQLEGEPPHLLMNWQRVEVLDLGMSMSKDSLLSEHVIEFLGVACLYGVVIGLIIEGLLCRSWHHAIETVIIFRSTKRNLKTRGPFVAVAVVMILIQIFDPAASTLAFSNQCSTPIAICNINASGPIIVQPNDAYPIEPSASLEFWAYKKSGDNMCTNMGNPVVTLAVIDFDNSSYSYSVSVAYGYNLGVKIMALGGTGCLPAACTAKLEDCPDDLKARGPSNVVIACNPPDCTESEMLCSLYSSLMGNSLCQKPGSRDQYSSKDARCDLPVDLAIIFKCD